ncbi:furin [Diachasma alloeum]|uniref:furin n=1 Tax=Diachasma alloeum TaxID=454923 RepID=UPI00073813FB|nr:furin [Diachasma alloeum]
MSPKVVLMLGLVLVSGIVGGTGSDVGPAAATRQRPSPVYSNEFAVHVPDGPEAAAAIAEKHGFDNIGQIFGQTIFRLHRRCSIANQKIEEDEASSVKTMHN